MTYFSADIFLDCFHPCFLPGVLLHSESSSIQLVSELEAVLCTLAFRHNSVTSSHTINCLQNVSVSHCSWHIFWIACWNLSSHLGQDSAAWQISRTHHPGIQIDLHSLAWKILLPTWNFTVIDFLRSASLQSEFRVALTSFLLQEPGAFQYPNSCVKLSSSQKSQAESTGLDGAGEVWPWVLVLILCSLTHCVDLTK